MLLRPGGGQGPRWGGDAAPHSRTPTTGKPGSTPMRAAPPPPPRPSGDLLPGAEVVQAEAGK